MYHIWGDGSERPNASIQARPPPAEAPCVRPALRTGAAAAQAQRLLSAAPCRPPQVYKGQKPGFDGLVKRARFCLAPYGWGWGIRISEVCRCCRHCCGPSLDCCRDDSCHFWLSNPDMLKLLKCPAWP
jgi:hypothetical protein